MASTRRHGGARPRGPRKEPPNRIKEGLSPEGLAKLDTELEKPLPEPPAAPAPPPAPPTPPTEVLDLQAIEAELCRRDLYLYLRAAWPLIEPARPFIDAWHARAISEHLQAVTAGQIKRLIVNIPPGSGKSSIGSVGWPTWVHARDPMARFISASYAEALAVRDCVRHRTVLRSDWFQQSFVHGDWSLVGERMDMVELDAGGRRQAVGTGSGTTGWRADCLILDDVSSASAAYSKAERDAAERWFRTVVVSRLDDPANASIVLIGQRIASDDLPGRLLADDPSRWELLMLPSEYESKRSRVTVLGWKDPRTVDGEALFPQLYPTTELQQAKKDMGSSVFAGQHQQNPVDAEGGMFQVQWWRFWHPDGRETGVTRPSGCWAGPSVPLPNLDRVLVSVDCTFKAAQTSDYVAATVWGQAGAQWFLLDLVRRRLSFTETLAMLRTLCARWPQARRVLVEEAANGAAVLDVLHKEIAGIVAVRATESKEARAASVSPLCEAGQVFLPDGAPYLGDFVTELAAFPRGGHDDMVDSTSMALRDQPAYVGALNLERGPFAHPSSPSGPRDGFGRPLLRVVP